jgi:hypothetical protein
MAPSAGNALSLIKAVLEIVADRRGGVLDVRSDGLRTQIYFADGKPQFAEDEALGESFGRLLMRQGVITNEQFMRVIDEMTRAAAGNNQLRFGEVAVGLGVLTPEQVQRGLAEQVCGIVTRCLHWGHSQWAFEPSPPAAAPPRAFSIQINPAILEALRQPADRSLVANVVAARPAELLLVGGARTAADGRDEGGNANAETHAARMAAELTFQKGLALLRETKTASAAIELRRASELQPESLEYLLYATWAKARSYREVPTEADREVLLDLAQRAKKRDPLFAFGSYVIGQLAMWSGDDASAKRWFYEALRLDPASEAGKQVRILARRGVSIVAPLPTAEAPFVAEAPPRPNTMTASEKLLDELGDSGKVAGPAPSPVAAAAPSPSPQAAPRVQPSAAPSGRWGRRVAGGALLAIGAAVVFVVARNPAPPAVSAPSAAAEPVAVDSLTPVDALPPVDSRRKDTLASDVPSAEKQTKALTTKSADDEADADVETTGTVLLPPRAAGHRIFVDGRRARSEGDAPLRLRCGSHVIQIGSGGEPETVEVPCRGEVHLQ